MRNIYIWKLLAITLQCVWVSFLIIINCQQKCHILWDGLSGTLQQTAATCNGRATDTWVGEIIESEYLIKNWTLEVEIEWPLYWHVSWQENLNLNWRLNINWTLEVEIEWPRYWHGSLQNSLRWKWNFKYKLNIRSWIWMVALLTRELAK